MKKTGKQKNFAVGALVLMIFGLISKVIGAFYRVPLTSVITSEGMGLYQMVFPLYTLMLTISSSGIPSSISKLISENVAKNNYKQANKIFKTSLIILFCFSFICSILIFCLAGVVSKIQGNINAKICYFGLAPAVLFVGLICGFRGYFQGLNIMTPSAVSGFFEQLFKAGFGLFLASAFLKYGISYACFGALLGVTISEILALVYLIIRYLLSNKKLIPNVLLGSCYSTKKTIKQILSLSIIVTLGGLIMPLVMLVDSSLVVNILKSIGYSTVEATKLFGIESGTVGSIINMPVVLSLSISTAILPCISREKELNNLNNVKQNVSKALTLTVILALPALVGCFTFSKEIILLLYRRSLSQEEIIIASNLLKIASFSILFLSLVQVCAGVLQGLNKFKTTFIALACGGIVKILLNIILIKNDGINIYGAEIATLSCYIVAFVIDFLVILKQKVINFDYKIFICFILSFLIYFSRYIYEFLRYNNLNFYLAFFTTVIFIAILYFFIIWVVYRKKIFTKHKKSC